MKYVYIGDFVNTHGIKGEIRLRSEFKYIDEVLKIGLDIYVGNCKDNLKISNLRKHKDYEMMKFENLNDINEVLIYKGQEVYINREDIPKKLILNEDLIGLEVYEKDNYLGTVSSVLSSSAHEIIVLKKNKKVYMLPYIKKFIKKIDLNEKKIMVKTIKGLFDEN